MVYLSATRPWDENYAKQTVQTLHETSRTPACPTAISLTYFAETASVTFLLPHCCCCCCYMSQPRFLAGLSRILHPENTPRILLSLQLLRTCCTPWLLFSLLTSLLLLRYKNKKKTRTSSHSLSVTSRAVSGGSLRSLLLTPESDSDALVAPSLSRSPSPRPCTKLERE
jgi:hypothetical protein